MITTFSEATCLLLLYAACPDEAVRRRALELVPELADLVVETTPTRARRRRFEGLLPSRARRRRLEAFGRLEAFEGLLPSRSLGHRFVVCRDEDLDEHKRDFALSFDLAVDVTVVAEDT